MGAAMLPNQGLRRLVRKIAATYGGLGNTVLILRKQTQGPSGLHPPQSRNIGALGGPGSRADDCARSLNGRRDDDSK